MRTMHNLTVHRDSNTMYMYEARVMYVHSRYIYYDYDT
jgi:hypothetical protein